MVKDLFWDLYFSGHVSVLFTQQKDGVYSVAVSAGDRRHLLVWSSTAFTEHTWTEFEQNILDKTPSTVDHMITDTDPSCLSHMITVCLNRTNTQTSRDRHTCALRSLSSHAKDVSPAGKILLYMWGKTGQNHKSIDQDYHVNCKKNKQKTIQYSSQKHSKLNNTEKQRKTTWTKNLIIRKNWPYNMEKNGQPI